MAKGFFTLSAPKVSPVQIRTPRCGECKLFQQCNSPKMPPTGKGKKGILIVAEAPGKTEDAQGIQLVGDAGQRLRQHLDMLDIDLDEDCIKTTTANQNPPRLLPVAQTFSIPSNNTTPASLSCLDKQPLTACYRQCGVGKSAQ